ncbi:MAG TPA: LCP family protein, partial [Anaerolineae bacterium]|nr:LCP family protein [Anaerolineae bacterium]
MEKKSWWILLGVFVLLLAACGQEIAPPRGEPASRLVVESRPPATAHAALPAVRSTADLTPALAAGRAFGQARPAAAVAPENELDSGEARIPESASVTVHPTHTPTRTPSPTAWPTHTPTRTPLPATATTFPTASPSASPPPVTGAADASLASTGTVTVTVAPPTLTPTPAYPPTPVPTVPAAASKDVVHFLLIGLDHGKNVKVELTDVMIVAVVNKKTAQVSMLSIPRDLWVYIPTYGHTRINMAHKLGYLNDYPGGGPALLAETIRINLGIPIDHWARIDFQGFAAAVDALGGVDLIVACPVELQYQPTTPGESQVLYPGEYHLDGATALRYVRTRRDGTDFDRARRQQQFLKAVWDQTRAPGLVSRIPGLWSALKGTFETDLNLGDVLSLAPLALEVKPQNVRSRYIAYGQTIDWTTHKGWRVLLPRQDEIQKVVGSLYAAPAAAAAPEEPGLRIAIENGTWRDGMALVAADRLRWEGFDVSQTSFAAERGQAYTQIIVYRDRPAAVKKLAGLLRARSENVIYQPD